MTTTIFISIFVAIAAADWWMDMVQRTTTLICRASDAPMRPVGELLNPSFVKFAFPLTLAKWILVAFWAWCSSVAVALAALAAAWLITILSPVPFGLTLPPIRKQIARVRSLDSDMGDQLLQLVEQWRSIGGRH
jgi:hypothetical protein